MTPNTNTTNRKPSIILIVVIVLAALILLPRLFNTNDTTAQTNVPVEQNSQSGDESAIQLGTPVSASGVDSSGCPTESQSTFAPFDDIYVVAPNSNIPQGTSLFVRLYRDNTVVEDAPEIQADRDYSRNCVNFVFQPTGADFEPGNYEAQFYINGNPGPSVAFSVQ